MTPQTLRLLFKMARGKLRRKLALIPDHTVVEEMPEGVRFEHKRLSILDEEDFRAMLTKSYDIALCDCLRRTLAPRDIVLDVGSNVGYIAAVAASCVGTSGEIHGFEPLAECFERLEALSRLNPQFHFIFNNAAAGAERGSLTIAYNPEGDIRNATLVPGKQGEQRPQTRQVPVLRLDQYIADRIEEPSRIKLIKIDVEGFEFAVLRGLENFFVNRRPRVVCEIKPWEIEHLGYAMKDFEAYMSRFAYRAYDMVHEDRPVDLIRLREMQTVQFLAN
jgi:FkbM family methyltransferase